MPLDPKAGPITGPPFIIIILNWALFGVLSIQVYLYSQAFPNDRRLLKGLVFGIYVLEMAQTFLLTQSIWSTLAMGFGNIEGMDEVGTTWVAIPVIGGIVALLVQLFYAYRILVISQSKIIPSFITFMSLVSFAGSLATATMSKRAGQFSNLLLNKTEVFTVLGLGGSRLCLRYYDHHLHVRLCANTTLCITLSFQLRRGTRQCIMLSRTQALVSKLIRMTIETGMLTASISILTVALYYTPCLYFTSYYEVPVSAQAKFYSTTMLAVLNSRIKLGIVSESATWRDDELAGTIPLSGAIVFNVATTSSHSINKV
ncbi:hypothetical protein BJ912DRAFT_880144 [Pholiota molesta]|nr:hypothetical protein BJ912DRAFT_880144 [Pholiota molesta]